MAELRTKLREADATFKVVKNSLTERAADQAGAESLKDYLAGPDRADVRPRRRRDGRQGDRRLRARHPAAAVQGRADGAASALDVDQIRSLSRLPSREVLYGQLVGVVASPVGGLVRSLGALLGGLAVALGQVREKKESGEIPAGEAPPAAPRLPRPSPRPRRGGGAGAPARSTAGAER